MVKRVNMLEKILIDSDIFVALANKKDNGHGWSKKMMNKIGAGNFLLYLTSFSYGEVLTVASQKLCHDAFLLLADKIEKGNFVMIDVDEKLRLEGLKWFAKQKSKNSRFTDCVNMAVMEKYGIRRVFSRDKHYKKNGFLRLGLDD
jgi:predicted nucleic acid-binding protein